MWIIATIIVPLTGRVAGDFTTESERLYGGMLNIMVQN